MAEDYVGLFNTDTPSELSPYTQGAKVLRDLKTTFFDSFPEIDEPVLATSEQLNNLTGNFLPGMIVAWYSTSDIPDGWSLCDGSEGTPDLTDMFVKGATEPGTNQVIYGNAGFSPKEYTSVNNHALTEAESPPHNHQGTFGTPKTTPNNVANLNSAYNSGTLKEMNTKAGNPNSSTVGIPHGHSVNAVEGKETISLNPANFLMMYIMKKGDTTR